MYRERLKSGGWHVPERSEGRGLRLATPFVPQGVPPRPQAMRA